MLFNVAPTFLEISLVSTILASKFGVAHAAVTLATVAAYTVFTVQVSVCVVCVATTYALCVTCTWESSTHKTPPTTATRSPQASLWHTRRPSLPG